MRDALIHLPINEEECLSCCTKRQSMDQPNAGNQQSSHCFKEEFQRLQYRRPVKFQCEPHIAARAQKFRAISFPVFPSIQLGRNSIRQLNPFRNYFVVGNSSLNDFALHYLLTFVNHHSNLVENFNLNTMGNKITGYHINQGTSMIPAIASTICIRIMLPLYVV